MLLCLIYFWLEPMQAKVKWGDFPMLCGGNIATKFVGRWSVGTWSCGPFNATQTKCHIFIKLTLEIEGHWPWIIRSSQWSSTYLGAFEFMMMWTYSCSTRAPFSKLMVPHRWYSLCGSRFNSSWLSFQPHTSLYLAYNRTFQTIELRMLMLLLQVHFYSSISLFMCGGTVTG